MDIFISSSNYDPMMASMAFPYQWVCLFDLKKLLNQFKSRGFILIMQWVQALVIILGYLPGRLATEIAGVKRETASCQTRRFFEAAIYVLAIHGVIYPMNRRIFQRDGVRRTQYSSSPSFHHSNCERSELSSTVAGLNN
jgi:hypothetical protein